MFVNLFLRPMSIFNDTQMERAKGFAKLIRSNRGGDWDVLCLCEAFDEACIDVLTTELKQAGFIHSTEVLGRHQTRLMSQIDSFIRDQRVVFTNGGIVVFSKYPIVEVDCQLFNFQQGEIGRKDGLARKGFMHTKILTGPGDRVCNIITTHFESERSEVGAQYRLKAAARLGAFVRNKKSLRCGDPVLIVGDFNEEGPKPRDAHWERLKALMNCGEFRHGIREITIDPLRNKLVGADGDDSVGPCRLDHCFYSQSHLSPDLHKSSIRALRLMYYPPTSTDTGNNVPTDLSDHYALGCVVSFVEERSQQNMGIPMSPEDEASADEQALLAAAAGAGGRVASVMRWITTPFYSLVAQVRPVAQHVDALDQAQSPRPALGRSPEPSPERSPESLV
jgi:endonuclease/exonuclease/phosphatase family metal-dependent hydrolase